MSQRTFMRWFSLLAAFIWAIVAITTVAAGVVGQFQCVVFGYPLAWWFVATAFLLAATSALDRFIGH